MPRPVAVAVAVLVALLGSGACSSDDESASTTSSSGNPVTSSPSSSPGEGTGSTVPAADEDSPPAWVATVTDAEVTPGEVFEGEVLWIDEPRRTVFVEDCEVARRATAEGGPYGPVDGPGFAYICR